MCVERPRRWSTFRTWTLNLSPMFKNIRRWITFFEIFTSICLIPNNSNRSDIFLMFMGGNSILSNSVVSFLAFLYWKLNFTTFIGQQPWVNCSLAYRWFISICSVSINRLLFFWTFFRANNCIFLSCRTTESSIESICNTFNLNQMLSFLKHYASRTMAKSSGLNTILGRTFIKLFTVSNFNQKSTSNIIF